MKYDSFSISRLAELRNCTTIEEAVKLTTKLFHPLGDGNKGKGAERWEALFEQETAARVRVYFMSFQASQIMDRKLMLSLSMQAPWDELEREARVIETYHNHLRTCDTGAACKQHHLYLTDDKGWHGGKVHFTGRLHYDEKAKHFDIVLERPFLFSSTRFARRFGSDAFVRLRVDSRVLYQHGKQVRKYAKRPLLISGRVFRAYYAKEETIFFFRTNEVVETVQVEDAGSTIHVREPRSPSTDPLSISLIEFLHWHNPVSLNEHQVRTALMMMTMVYLTLMVHSLSTNGRRGLRLGFPIQSRV